MAEDELSILLKTFTQIQIKFVAARLSSKSDKEAAGIVGISPNTVYSWPNKSKVDRAVQIASLDSFELAHERLTRLMITAVDVLEEEMGKGKKRRLEAACEVLDRVGVSAKRSLDVTSGGEPLPAAQVTIFIPDNERGDQAPEG